MVHSWAQIHLAAAIEARRAHNELGIDVTRRIDPFAALERSGIVVMRQRLDKLAGIYLPGDPGEGTPPGVLINVVHPLSKQRYTAAHELSHHRRDRQLVLDTETEWAARGVDHHPRPERFAEAFAAWFLMPRQLVERVMTSLDLLPQQLDASAIYTLSLEFGTSYAATLHHLAGMKLISNGQRQRLRKVSPQTIKQTLGTIAEASDPWKDIRLVRSHQRGEVGALAGDVVIVEVPEAPSSGFLWQPSDVSSGLALVGDEYQPSDPLVLGGRGQHRFLFRVDSSGRLPIQLTLGRPWQPEVTADSFVVEVVSEPLPVAGIVHPEMLVQAGS